MILSDKDIQKRLATKNITINPPPTIEQIQPSSIDLRLGNEFLLPISDTQPLDIKNNSPRYERIQCNVMQLPPKAFILATTKETVHVPSDLVARVEGRSSVGRLGIAIHITAGFIDPNFKGQITLEIANHSNNTILLYEDMRICQIVFEELTNTPNRLYGECGNKYQNQEGTTGSMIFYDEDTLQYGGKG